MDVIQLRDNAKQQLEQIKDIETGFEYLNKVKAIETWAKAEKKDAELQNLIAEQKIRTQRVLGRLIEEGQQKGEIASQQSNRRYDIVTNNDYIDKPKTLSDIGITRNESSTFQKIASLPDELFEKEIALAKEDSEKRVELTTSRVLTAAKEYQYQKKKQDAEISDRDRDLIARLMSGDTVIININTDLATIRHAEKENLYVRCDRFSPWGNPFEIEKDGDRETVCDNYELHYILHKPSLLRQITSLRGKALGCWCAPNRCHCETLKRLADEKI